ncbi:MAG: hypothetical protein U0531_13120 [Dehalococcoidia bacterium]
MDEIAALREELETARGESAQLAARLAERETRAGELERTTDELRQELEAAHGERRAAVMRYRETLLTHAPELPAELVGGETVAAIDHAVQAARDLVARVRGQILAETTAGAAAPAGSPARRPLDTGSLSAGEKIRHGLATREG